MSGWTSPGPFCGYRPKRSRERLWTPRDAARILHHVCQRYPREQVRDALLAADLGACAGLCGLEHAARAREILVEQVLRVDEFLEIGNLIDKALDYGGWVLWLLRKNYAGRTLVFALELLRQQIEEMRKRRAIWRDVIAGIDACLAIGGGFTTDGGF